MGPEVIASMTGRQTSAFHGMHSHARIARVQRRLSCRSGTWVASLAVSALGQQQQFVAVSAGFPDCGRLLEACLVQVR
jgi:hypothetical protein